MTASSKRIHIETYGCQMNEADSDLMKGLLISVGHEIVDSPNGADVILVNTCAVRRKAEDRVVNRLRALVRLKQDHPHLLLGICGCVAKHLRQQLFDLVPELDLVVGPDSYRRIPQMLESANLPTCGDHVDAMPSTSVARDGNIDVRLRREELYEGIDPLHQGSISATLTIMRGCDQFCSFCVVPFVRGRERSQSPAEITRQAIKMARAGVREIVLLGQTVNAYKHGDTDFADLLHQMAQLEGIERIRFTSPHPNFFSEKLIHCLGSNEKLCHHVHLPLQSGSDPILTRMRRDYTAEAYAALVGRLRDTIPDLGLTTDIVVGFPGESERDFEDTLHVVRALRFDSAFMFHYSEREGTHAARNYPDDVQRDVKLERLARLIDVQEEIGKEQFAAMIGREVHVLIEGPSRRDERQMCGRTNCFKTTVVTNSQSDAGQIVKARVISSTGHTLIAEA